MTNDDNIVDFNKQKPKHVHKKKEAKVKKIKDAFNKAFDINKAKKDKKKKKN